MGEVIVNLTLQRRKLRHTLSPLDEGGFVGFELEPGFQFHAFRMAVSPSLVSLP